MFIGWPAELEVEKTLLQAEIETKLKCAVSSFPKFEVYAPFGVMSEAYRNINQCDAAVILIGKRFSAPVYAEFLEAAYRLGPSLVFVGVQKSTERDDGTKELLDQVRLTHIWDEFGSPEELASKIASRLSEAIKRFQEHPR